MIIRPATPADVAPLIALIDRVYREYGDVIYLEGADGDLLDIDRFYRAQGGEFVVLDDAGSVRGAHAVLPFAQRRGVTIGLGLLGAAVIKVENPLTEWALQSAPRSVT